MSSRPVFPPSLARRLAKRRLQPTSTRPLHTSSPILNISAKPEPSSIPPSTALSALLSRLSLPSDTSLHPTLISCLTHPSYYSYQSQSQQQSEELPELEIVDFSSSSSISKGDNELLSTLGNSLLGLFASEHISSLYPLLPTQAIKNAITAYVGPSTCLSVARELGVSVQGGGNMGQPGLGRGSNSAGLPIRWSKVYIQEKNYQDNVQGENVPSRGPEKVPVARRFQKFLERDNKDESESESRISKRRENFEDVVAATVRAFVGLIYQEQGIHAARSFVHAHFLSRSIDLTSLFNFKNPLHMLSSVISSHLSSAGVPISANQGIIEKRLLASTGVNSQSPLFLVGLFLPSGIKLAEGHGSSKAMAEYRAAKNALLSLYLVRSEQTSPAEGLGIGSGAVSLPSSLYASSERWLDHGKISENVNESEQSFRGANWGGKEVIAESRDLRRKV
ncbi:hypothetical protein I302_104274 [Kwoniella bestiolae CBS 10118]|uniref:Large ribosomal subunit protein mL44 n=1 Tax=Kwoniella bestiolae CBS 10118 TaxID=1296100 RepID=A0A1B9GAT9_9TREE|nr:hypothetical protein I302_02982 [Kwoniella bestiolae CBS 10118]OCF28131.1 hypothetical protein I302_02982 [Kwoniella bestiolae CBS 10118]